MIPHELKWNKKNELHFLMCIIELKAISSSYEIIPNKKHL